MFQIGDKVFYPTGGVCIIDDIKVMPFPGLPKDRLYYCLHALHGGTDSIFVPVDSEQSILRPLITPDEAEAFMQTAQDIPVVADSNIKLLKETMNEALNTHNCALWFSVIKTVYAHQAMLSQKSKRISDTERSLYDTARRYLYGELAAVLDKPLAQIEESMSIYLSIQ